MERDGSAGQLCPPEILGLIFDLIAQDTLRPLLVRSGDMQPAPSGRRNRKPATFSLGGAISSTGFREHNATFSALALVCTAWCSPAMEALYQTLCVSEPGQLPRLLASSKAPLDRVRHLVCAWNRQPCMIPDPDLALLPPIFDCATSMTHLTLAGEQFDLTSSSLLSSMRRRSLPGSGLAPIVGFACPVLANTTYIQQRLGPQDRRTSASIGALLWALKDVQHVRLDEFRSSYLATVPSLPLALGGNEAFPRQITSLSLNCVVLESVNLERLLVPLKGQLRHLSLNRTSLATCAVFRSILQKIGAELRTLEIKDCDFWATWDTADDASAPALMDSIVTLCPSLVRLVFVGTFDSRSPGLSTPHATLRSLTLGSRCAHADTVAEAIEADEFLFSCENDSTEERPREAKELKILSSCGWSDGEFARVAHACLGRGIRFHC